MELKNEFARVFIEVDYSANGVRLKIVDMRTGKVNYLDPFELESLAWARHEELTRLMDPAKRN